MKLTAKSDISVRDQWARGNAILGIKGDWNALYHSSPSLQVPISSLGPLGKDEPLGEPPAPEQLSEPEETPKEGFKVGIIGAGAAGLFTGLIFDYLKSRTQGALKINYDILEAASENRVGGRLYTYNFKPQPPENPPGPHDYYDVGAMRFPKNPVMHRVFALFDFLGMHEVDPSVDNPPNGTLIPYFMNGKIEPWCFNDKTSWGNSGQIFGKQDTFSLNTDGKIPLGVFAHSPDQVMLSILRPFRDALKTDGERAWKLLMEYDSYSTRQYLAVRPPPPIDSSTASDKPSLDPLMLSDKPSDPQIQPPPYNYDTIEWLETFNGGTTWYDQAHSETILESLDFEYAENTEWKCILGGAQQLAIRMESKLRQKPTYNSRVTAIRALPEERKVEVDFQNKNNTHTNTYDGVFNSTTLGCLKQIDTSNAGLSYGTKQAIRSLGYGPSAKAAIKFNKPWWIYNLGDHNIKSGGLGHSDLTIRTCVYPSYNIYDPKDKPAVLLCSYTWQQDAQRIASLISSADDNHHDQQKADEQRLKELLLRELTLLHSKDGKFDEDLYTHISESYLDHHAHDWYHDPNTVGAFAFFRPQQFSEMWSKIIQPSGNVVIIGEAASPHHAWVVGALESAVHGVHAWLGLNKDKIRGATDAIKILEEKDPKIPFVGLPPYMQQNMSYWHSFLARATDDVQIQKMKLRIG